MSDTENTFDFGLYDQAFKSIINDLDKAIIKLFRDKNNGQKMNFKDVQDLLGQADRMALNMGDKFIAGLGQDEITYTMIKAKIDESMQEIKGKINGLKGVVADKKKNSKLDRMVEENIDNGKTNKVLKETAKLYKEDDKTYEREDLDIRIKNAKKEKADAEKMLDQRKDYDDAITAYITANPSSSKTDAETALDNEFQKLKTASENWRNEAQRLQRIGDYDYENKLEDLIDLANSQTDVTPELAKEFKMFRKRVKDFSNHSISQYFDTIDKDPTNEDIDTIRNILNNFSSLDLQNEREIKEPEKVLETIQNDYKDLVSGNDVTNSTTGQQVKLKYILEAFPEMKNEILSEIEAGNTGKIDEILKETRTMLREFPKKSKDALKYEKEHADKKIVIYENENRNMETVDSNAPTERPEVPEYHKTDELDLTDLVGEDFKIQLDGKVQEDGSVDNFDFATIAPDDEKAKEAWAVEAYEELRRNNPNEHRKIMDNLPIKKPGNRFTRFFRGLRNLGRKITGGRPSVEERDAKKAIKEILKQRIGEKSAQKEENAQKKEQYADAVNAFEARLALTEKQKGKFNQAVAQIIADRVKKGKKINKQEANSIKEAAEEKIL